MIKQANSLFTQYKSLNGIEKAAFRALIQEENLSTEEVFGHLKGKEFSSQDSADYLGVSIPTFRRYLANKRLSASSTIGRNHLYRLEDLRSLKKELKLKKTS